MHDGVKAPKVFFCLLFFFAFMNVILITFGVEGYYF